MVLYMSFNGENNEELTVKLMSINGVQPNLLVVFNGALYEINYQCNLPSIPS